MATEDDEIRYREVWSDVARSWYSKAVDKNPQIGRFYHRLGILARTYSLQQLSFYTRSLTCITPFESARSSIMTFFNSISSRRDPSSQISTSWETIFIRAHVILFTGQAIEIFLDVIQQLREGLLDTYIDRVTAKFKEQGVYATLANISALLEYGILEKNGSSGSILRLAYEQDWALRRQKAKAKFQRSTDNALDINDNSDRTDDLPKRTIESLSPTELDVSKEFLSKASTITFLTMSISLQRIGDKNILPLAHCSCVFIWSLVVTKNAISYIESNIPWGDLCTFFNTLAKPKALTPKVFDDSFPKPDMGVGRPLAEDWAAASAVIVGVKLFRPAPARISSQLRFPTSLDLQIARYLTTLRRPDQMSYKEFHKFKLQALLFFVREGQLFGT